MVAVMEHPDGNTNPKSFIEYCDKYLHFFNDQFRMLDCCGFLSDMKKE
jgi:hypothetical protein